jgi:ATP-dependent NAD(P)H-hydrate dehydratase
VRDSAARVVVTPNKVEFERLCSALQIPGGEKGGDAFARAETLAAEVARGIGGNVLLVVKGPQDVISDGAETLLCSAEGSPRRSGGQGDVLAGLMLAFQLWSERAAEAAAKEEEASASSPALAVRLDLACAWAACEVRDRARCRPAPHLNCCLFGPPVCRRFAW